MLDYSMNGAGKISNSFEIKNKMNSYLLPYIKWNFRWIEDQYVKKQNYKFFRRKYKWIYLCVRKYFFQIYTKSSTHKEERLINLPTVNSQKTSIQQKTH